MKYPVPLLCALAVLLAACGGEADVQPAGDTTAVVQPAPRYPASKSDTLYLEGMPEPVTLKLFDEPGLPFVTYYPSTTITTQTTSSDEGILARFNAAFGDTEEPEAHLQFFFPSPEAGLYSVQAMQDLVTGLIESNAWRLTEDPAAPPPCPWAQAQYRFAAPDTAEAGSGFACIGVREGWPFYVLTYVPEQYAEGFGPRMRVLLRAFRWRDDGTGLTETE